DFLLERSGRLGVRLCVGDLYEGWPFARNPGRIEKFVAVGPSGELPIVGLDGSEPAGVVRLIEPGSYVLAYRSNRAFTEMSPVDFDRYLRDEGLERIAALQATGDGVDRGVREAYSRHARALIQVGDAGVGKIDRVTGLRLELLADPDLLRPVDDGPRSFRLLHDGDPISGVLVKATRPGTTDVEQRKRTGPDGRVSFRLRAPGMWRIAATHMIAAPRGVTADWESFWASLTFELRTPDLASARATGPSRSTACRNRIARSPIQALR
ncbi:MAG: DUF4198 domain-containing protein, partial [Gemmatimonadetes bacterium]|nr:DUF4198 domain-containing protein [Gemmatimonadota bacterium]